jgi:hypothetical protein
VTACGAKRVLVIGSRHGSLLRRYNTAFSVIQAGCCVN